MFNIFICLAQLRKKTEESHHTSLVHKQEDSVPSDNQTWQWKIMDHVSMIFQLKAPFIGDVTMVFPAFSHHLQLLTSIRSACT